MANEAGAAGTTARLLIGAALSAPLLLWVTHSVVSESTWQWVWSEQGPLELSHVFLPLLAAATALATFAKRPRGQSLRASGVWSLAAVMGVFAVLCVGIAGEECSWGQHFVGWSTPEGWNQLNDQQETNLHNMSSWADQKPRAVIELWVFVFGLLWPILDSVTSIRVPASWRLILLPRSVLPLAICAESVRLLEWAPRYLGVSPLAAFPRPSELQELYFYTLFACCMLAWRQRLLTRLQERPIRVPLDSIERPLHLQKRAA